MKLPKVLGFVFMVVIAFAMSFGLAFAQAAPGGESAGGVLAWIGGALAVVPDWVEAIGLLISAAAAIAAVTKNVRDDEAVTAVQKLWKQLRRIIDLLALNVGNAKNKEPEPTNAVKTSGGPGRS